MDLFAWRVREVFSDTEQSFGITDAVLLLQRMEELQGRDHVCDPTLNPHLHSEWHLHMSHLFT